MKDGAYILVNGQFVSFAEYKISLEEAESLLFTEKIRSIRTSFPFFKESCEMIKMKLLLFNQSCPELIDKEGAELKRQMERTLTRNKHFLGAVLSIRFWLSGQKLQYSMHSAKTEHSGFELNEKGLYIAISREIRKPIYALSSSILGSELYWKIAGFHSKEESSEIVLINNKNYITEAPYSNIYLIKEGVAKGAPIKHGAYADISKLLMLRIFAKLEISYSESEGITEQDLREADEIFLVNALEGIRWVMGFEGKRYFNQVTRKINNVFVSTFFS
jgi:branched-chain amino acid aminotransferase